MPVSDWRRMTRLSIMSMVMYSMRLGLFALSYLAERYGTSYTGFIEYTCDRDIRDGKDTIIREELNAADRYIDDLLDGKGRGVELPKYGATYWDLEETILLRSLERLDEFYAEMFELICEFLAINGHEFDGEEIAEVVRYQQMRMPTTKPQSITKGDFKFNLPEYFHNLFGTDPIAVTKEHQVLSVTPRPFDGDFERFAKEAVIWGRNSDTMLLDCQWRSIERPWIDSSQIVREDKDVEALGLPRAANLGSRES